MFERVSRKQHMAYVEIFFLPMPYLKIQFLIVSLKTLSALD